MKVLHVIPSAAARDGGPNAAVRAMSRELVRQGMDVTVATTDADGNRRLEVPLDVPVPEGGAEFRYFPRSIPGSWKFSWPLTRWLAEHAHRFDVVHVHALFSYATIPACRLSARAGRPYVLRPLGTLERWSLAHRAWKKRPYYALVERRHLADAGAIHVTSESERDAIAALGFGDRARLVPLGVDVRGPRAPAARALHEPLRLLYVSRLHPVKGLPLLFAAIARQVATGGSALELVVAGDGEPAYRAALESTVRAAGLESIVRFVGHVEGDAKRALLEYADVFVLPSHQESFGLAVAEALGAGLPVVVTDRVGIARDIAGAGAGEVVPPDASAIAAAIGKLASAPELRADMGRRGAELARRSWSWERAGRDLVAIYQELASRSLARRTA